MNILNSNEAFAAMMAGRNIMCRAIGELIEFDDIDQFPANIFAKPGYEFCIKVETMELAGITFTKPLTFDDVVEDQEIFLVYPNCIVHTHFTSLSGKYVECVRYGFAQADQENAELQLQAIGKLLGRAIPYPLTIESHYKPEKKRSTKAKKAKNEADQVNIPADSDTTVVNIEKQPEPKVLQPVDTIDVTPSATNEIPVRECEEPAIETDPVKLVEMFTAEINAAESVDAVMQIRYKLNANGHMVRGQIIELNKLGEKRIEELTRTPSVSKDLSVDELKRLQEEAEKLIQSQKDESTEQPVQVDEDAIHQELLKDLLECVAKATTPAEVNAQIKYTKSWTPEQRTPVIHAINKRLVELNPPKAQSSLAVRIQKAEDLTELDTLEIDVSACDPEIQPRLMEQVEKRRLELDPFTAAIGEP